MNKTITTLITFVLLIGCVANPQDNREQEVSITVSDITKVGTSIPAAEIGEPVGSVKLYPPRWIEADETTPAHAVVEGSIMPVDPEGWPSILEYCCRKPGQNAPCNKVAAVITA